MDIQWLPSSIKFDQESAFPKELKISTYITYMKKEKFRRKHATRAAF
jgi:hypothetical protein